MTRRQKATFTPQVDGLERREVLSTFIHTSIPFVFRPAGVNQFAINFTSNTFHQVLNSLNAGAKRLPSNFLQTGNVTTVETQLTALSRRIPYGEQVLLPFWKADVENAVGTTTTPAAVLQELESDLRTYLVDNEGSAFNVQKSGVNWSTDGLLTFNSRVGHGVARGQEAVIGVTPTGL